MVEISSVEVGNFGIYVTASTLAGRGAYQEITLMILDPPIEEGGEFPAYLSLSNMAPEWTQPLATQIRVDVQVD